MLVYKATEKDCIGEDGIEIECIICLEEFEVGDEMSRLECLCKFHKVCSSNFYSCLLSRLLTWPVSRNALETGGRRKVQEPVRLINCMISIKGVRGRYGDDTEYIAANLGRSSRRTFNCLSIAIHFSNPHQISIYHHHYTLLRLLTS
jgi:hypothetical protein